MMMMMMMTTTLFMFFFRTVLYAFTIFLLLLFFNKAKSNGGLVQGAPLHANSECFFPLLGETFFPVACLGASYSTLSSDVGGFLRCLSLL